MPRNRKRSRDQTHAHVKINEGRLCKRRSTSPESAPFYSPLNDSNTVPIKKLLKSIVHRDTPVLFFPEYALRRIKFEHGIVSQELRRLYFHLLNHVDEDKQQLKGMSFTEIPRSHKFDLTQNSNTLYQQLALSIVIPMSSSTALKVAATIESVVWEETLNDKTVIATDESQAPHNPASNIYKRSTARPACIPYRSQLLSNLIDDVIFTLVQRSVMEPRIPLTSKQKNVRKGNRQRNPMCRLSLGRNILCEGYEYVKGQHSNSIGACRNMAPGIQCRQTNSCAAFARTSPVMHLMHQILGDDLLRELMMNTVVLLPLFDTSQNEPSLRSDYRIGNNQGNVYPVVSKLNPRNYFQLCGRPLSLRSALIDLSNLLGRDAATTSRVSSSTTYKWNPHEEIPRWEIFYSDSFTPKVGFPSLHILNTLSKDVKNESVDTHASRRLLQSLVQISASHVKRGKKRRFDYVRINGERICGKILENHTTCDYGRLLERYCPLPKENGLSLQGNPASVYSAAVYKTLLSSSCSSTSVTSFMKAVIVRLFPLEFWGSKSNLHIFLDTLTEFISLRRGETLTMKRILHGIHVMDMKWLYMAGNHDTAGFNKKRKLPSDVHDSIRFSASVTFKELYRLFVIPLLRSTFYITESQVSSGIIFFRKPVWYQIRSLGLTDLQKSHQFLSLSYDEGIRQISTNKLGASKLRLLPKSSKLRPILNLAKAYRFPCTKNNMALNKSRSSANAFLRTAFEVLKYELSLKPNSIGSGVSYHDIHAKYIQFISQLPKFPVHHHQLFFASIDIERCFDNISQDLMYKILEEFISEDEYILQQYFVVYNSENKKKAHLKTNVEKSFNVVPFHKLLTDRINVSYSTSVIVDGMKATVVKRKYILDLLYEHLCRNMIVAQDNTGPRIMQQKIGIAQGSILSTLLCNLYYGYHELTFFDGMIEKTNPSSDVHFIVRVVDDFLFVSTQKEAVCRFITKVHSGLPVLGMNINKEKSRCSFDFQSDSLGIAKTVSKGGNGNEYFSWCGLLFNTCTGAVHVDYERFSTGRAVDSVVMNKSGSEGLGFLSKMRYFVQPRTLSILYDLRINTVHDILLNYSQAIILCAIKAHAYLSKMDDGYEKNPAFILSVIESTIDYFYSTIRLRLKGNRNAVESVECIRQESPIVLFAKNFSRSTAKWLGLHIFASTWAKILHNEHVAVLMITNRYRRLSIRDVHSLRMITDEAMAIFDLICA